MDERYEYDKKIHSVLLREFSKSLKTGDKKMITSIGNLLAYSPVRAGSYGPVPCEIEIWIEALSMALLCLHENLKIYGGHPSMKESAALE